MAERPVVPSGMVDQLARILERFPECASEPAWVGVRWRVAGATIAHVFGGEDQQFRLTFRADPDEVMAFEHLGHPYFRAGWGENVVGLILDETVDWTEIAELLTDSYCLQAPAHLVAEVDRPEPTEEPRQNTAGGCGGIDYTSHSLHGDDGAITPELPEERLGRTPCSLEPAATENEVGQRSRECRAVANEGGTAGVVARPSSAQSDEPDEDTHDHHRTPTRRGRHQRLSQRSAAGEPVGDGARHPRALGRAEDVRQVPRADPRR
ncbi:MmcQ/YjbR family DNA-binding protein [Ammonicoccus fulvus]|uniref:MmcQ/YjbR family DNA-binding protein n=1 Tax=Ammonicoccus fulvus TaxID=3138240 RepID=A0ABZ3FP10_9ACTN